MTSGLMRGIIFQGIRLGARFKTDDFAIERL